MQPEILRKMGQYVCMYNVCEMGCICRYFGSPGGWVAPFLWMDEWRLKEKQLLYV